MAPGAVVRVTSELHSVIGGFRRSRPARADQGDPPLVIDVAAQQDLRIGSPGGGVFRERLLELPGQLQAGGEIDVAIYEDAIVLERLVRRRDGLPAAVLSQQ